MSPARRRTGRWARSAVALLGLLLLLSGGLVSTAAQEPNVAGLVILHGDGTLVYALVRFEEESINGLELIERSGVDSTVAPFGGLGGGVCSLNGEGCPSDDCWCKSYSSPAFYWHYFIQAEDGWKLHPLGPASRDLGNGDIDGWSWTSGDQTPPETSIGEIAEMVAVDASTREPDAPSTATSAVPSATTAETRQPDPTVTPDDRSANAVVVAPGATPEALATGEPDADASSDSYLLFAGLAAVVVLVGVVVVARSSAGAR